MLLSKIQPTPAVQAGKLTTNCGQQVMIWSQSCSCACLFLAILTLAIQLGLAPSSRCSKRPVFSCPLSLSLSLQCFIQSHLSLIMSIHKKKIQLCVRKMAVQILTWFFCFAKKEWCIYEETVICVWERKRDRAKERWADKKIILYKYQEDPWFLSMLCVAWKNSAVLSVIQIPGPSEVNEKMSRVNNPSGMLLENGTPS